MVSSRSSTIKLHSVAKLPLISASWSNSALVLMEGGKSTSHGATDWERQTQTVGVKVETGRQTRVEHSLIVSVVSLSPLSEVFPPSQVFPLAHGSIYPCGFKERYMWYQWRKSSLHLKLYVNKCFSRTLRHTSSDSFHHFATGSHSSQQSLFQLQLGLVRLLQGLGAHFVSALFTLRAEINSTQRVHSDGSILQ